MKLRILSTRAHGIMDYLVASFLPLMPRLLGCSESVKRIFYSTALIASASTICTDFEAGLIKEIPVKGHLAIDGATAAALLGAATVNHQQKRDGIILAIAGLYFLATATMTETVSSRQMQLREQRRQGAMARHEVQTPMEEYAEQSRSESAETR